MYRKFIVTILLLLLVTGCVNNNEQMNDESENADDMTQVAVTSEYESEVKDILAGVQSKHLAITTSKEETRVEEVEETVEEAEMSYIERLDKYYQDIYYTDDEGRRRTKPIIMDRFNFSEEAHEYYEYALEVYDKLQGTPYEDMSEEEGMAYEYIERGFSPWDVDPGCGWYCGYWFHDAIASSELDAIGDNNYVASNINDFSLYTCWSEGVKGYGVGESVSLLLEGPSTPSGFIIYNGYSKNEETYSNNSRAKELLVTVNNTEIVILELEDTRQGQSFSLDLREVDLESDREFEFEILSVYEGDKYDDTCISAIVVSDGH